jgi:hypothetical protein
MIRAQAEALPQSGAVCSERRVSLKFSDSFQSPVVLAMSSSAFFFFFLEQIQGATDLGNQSRHGAIFVTSASQV